MTPRCTRWRRRMTPHKIAFTELSSNHSLTVLIARMSRRTCSDPRPYPLGHFHGFLRGSLHCTPRCPFGTCLGHSLRRRHRGCTSYRLHSGDGILLSSRRRLLRRRWPCQQPCHSPGTRSSTIQLLQRSWHSWKGLWRCPQRSSCRRPWRRPSRHTHQSPVADAPPAVTTSTTTLIPALIKLPVATSTTMSTVSTTTFRV